MAVKALTVSYYLWSQFIDGFCSSVAHSGLSSHHGEYPVFSAFFFCPQVPMVELVCGVPSHASCHDRPPGYVGGPLAPGWPGPSHRGFSAAHRHLHPDGRPARGHNPAHQAGECCCASPSCITHTQTLSNGCFDRVAVVVRWEYFLWVHLSLWDNKFQMTLLCLQPKEFRKQSISCLRKYTVVWLSQWEYCIFHLILDIHSMQLNCIYLTKSSIIFMCEGSISEALMIRGN